MHLEISSRSPNPIGSITSPLTSPPHLSRTPLLTHCLLCDSTETKPQSTACSAEVDLQYLLYI